MSNMSVERDVVLKKIKAAYHNFYQRLRLAEDRLAYRSTRSGMWATSAAEEVYGGFCHFQLDKYTHMADLGSGDGIVVLIASLFTQATGYEIDEWLFQQSLKMLKSLKLTNARFLRQDFHQADLSAYDLLYLYPDKPFYELEESLHPTWSGHLLVNGPHFPPRHLKKVAESPPSIGRFVLYESP
jgi:hypothetical protein